tara:strand:- start:3411 stop:4679 length:1269 start_codon:yes stop_codon:yes gene_type:complete
MKPPHKVSSHAPLSPRMDYNGSMKNTHLEHLEDDILNSGATGGFNVIDFLKAFGHQLDDGKSCFLSITTKWDGAPAIICGKDPVNQRFFVGTKSVFNKVNPKVCYDDTDIDRYYHTEEYTILNKKLKTCLKYLSKTGIVGVMQGDLLFTQEDKKFGRIGDDIHITFQPNTITYAVDALSDKGRRIDKAKLGIVFHTLYFGDTLQDMKAVFNKNWQLHTINTDDDIFIANANFTDEAGLSKFSVRDSSKYTAIINRAEGSLKRASSFLDIIHEQGQTKFVMAVVFKQFFNNRIRTGKGIKDTKRIASEFAQFYSIKMDEEIGKKKTEKTKAKYKDMKKAGLAFIAKYETDIYFTAASYISLRSAKKMVIDQLSKASDIKTFVDNQPCKPEGYVVSYKGSILKFVDDDFRKANITVQKSWDLIH